MTEPIPAVAARPPPDRRRWLVLAVLCASVFVVVLDGTIVNVALPTLATELGASTSQLQWIVDAYVLVFAGLLMAAGSLGDRVGRKGVMQVGLGPVRHVLGARRDCPTAPATLIGWRAAMGVGAALMFPATLAILVNVFTAPRSGPRPSPCGRRPPASPWPSARSPAAGCSSTSGGARC